jgi:hypothetical protein
MPEVNYFDPSRWAVPDSEPPLTDPATDKERRTKGRKPAPFLKGPLPWPWLLRAMQLPGKTVAVALMLWKESGCQRARTFQFVPGRAAVEGISRWTIHRSLQRLESVGLIGIRRHSEQRLEITLRVKEEG